MQGTDMLEARPEGAGRGKWFTVVNGVGEGAFSAGKWQVQLWDLVQGRQRLKIVGQAGMPREVAGDAGQRAEAP